MEQNLNYTYPEFHFLLQGALKLQTRHVENSNFEWYADQLHLKRCNLDWQHWFLQHTGLQALVEKVTLESQSNTLKFPECAKSMDFITHPKGERLWGILVIINWFSKYATFIPTTKLCSVELIAHLFFKNVLKLWGVPSSIVSDRDGRFIGTLWTELFAFLGTRLNISLSCHPQTNGQTEGFNCMLKEYLRHFVDFGQKNWA